MGHPWGFQARAALCDDPHRRLRLPSGAKGLRRGFCARRRWGGVPSDGPAAVGYRIQAGGPPEKDRVEEAVSPATAATTAGGSAAGAAAAATATADTATTCILRCTATHARRAQCSQVERRDCAGAPHNRAQNKVEKVPRTHRNPGAGAGRARSAHGHAAGAGVSLSR